MVITSDEIAARIENFVRTEFRVPERDRHFSRDAELFELGFVDSTGAVELISFVESTFDIKLDDEHLFSPDFTTINGISRLICHLVAGKAEGHV